MIQLSDTKAAPGLGALLGAKPKAGGDASAFALAFGSLAADGQPGFSITIPRQLAAAPGNALPDGRPGDAEGSATEDSEAVVLSLPTDAVLMPPVLVSAATHDTPPLVASSEPSNAATSIEPGPEATANRPIAMGQSGHPTIADTAAAISDAIDTAPIAPPTTPTVDLKAQPAPLPPVAPPAPAASAAPERIAPSEQAIPSPPRSDGKPTADPRTAMPSPPANTTAQPAPTVAPLPTTAPATPPLAPPSVTASAADKPAPRAALSARLHSSAAHPAQRQAPAPGKIPVGPTATSVIAQNTPVAVPATPSRFVVGERLADATREPAAPRRVAVSPVVTAGATIVAPAITVVDLIPVEYRPRTGTTPIVTITDPASIGLSAPVEAASRIAEPPPIGTQAPDWIEGMIEQIEVMRDARADGAAATTTRIRLSPDALGAIEIVLSGEGDAIDVRINADTAAARTLLAEAAPRLADMAEARGLKLAQGDAGQPGQQQAQRQQAQDQPTANRRHSPGSATTGGNPDERIA